MPTFSSPWITILSLFVGCTIGAGLFLVGEIVTRVNEQTVTNQRFVTLERQIGIDEQASCLIQARGLPASHELASSLQDFHMLLSALITQSAENPQRHMTAYQQVAAQQDLATVKALNASLGSYEQLEAEQPQTRT